MKITLAAMMMLLGVALGDAPLTMAPRSSAPPSLAEPRTCDDDGADDTAPPALAVGCTDPDCYYDCIHTPDDPNSGRPPPNCWQLCCR